jgi:hypothetical protein
MQFVIGGLVCPLRARIPPNKPNLVAVKVKIRPIKPQIPQKLFIPSKSQAWTLFEGSLPRGSLGAGQGAGLLELLRGVHREAILIHLVGEQGNTGVDQPQLLQFLQIFER